MDLTKFSAFLKGKKSMPYKYSIWLALLTLGFSLVAKELFSLDLDRLILTFKSLSLLQYFSFFAFGILAVSLMSIYDFVLRKEFNLDISIKDTFKVAWVSNTIGNLLGETPTNSGGISYLLYQSEGIDSNKATVISIIKNTLFISPDDSDIDFLKISVSTRLYLIGGVLAKWIASAFLFSYILACFVPDISLLIVFVVFVLGMFISLFSRIPGGIGVFELVCLSSLSYLGIPIQVSILGILSYRLFYYIIPWLSTLFMVAIRPLFSSKLKVSPTNKRLFQHMSVQATAALILFAGLLIIFSSSIPVVREQFILTNSFIPIDFARVSTLSSMGIGLILLILSKGIYNKVASSYYLTLIFLVLGAMLSLIQNFNFTEFLILLLIASILFFTQEYFYRETVSLNLRKFLSGYIYLLGVSFIYLLIYTMFISPNSLSLTQRLNAMFYGLGEFIAFFLIIGLGALLLNLVSVRKVDFAMPTDDDLEYLRGFLDKYEGNSMTHLLFLKDKSLFYAMDNQVLIAFRPYKDNLMVLGDPIGNPALFKEAINAFRIYADKFDMIPIFYEINEENLPIYHENGFNFLKLGEEATFHLDEFILTGKRLSHLRTIKNKMMRKEFEFELLESPIPEDIMHQLKIISDEWLGDRKEKGFSLGSFNEDYINLAPVALVKKDDEIIAFATIMPMYQKSTISIDLMRLIQSPPNGTMDALFIGIIEWAIAEGYEHFVLGKAPLSNVGLNQFSKKREKIVKHLYNYGNKIYSFKGLRRFKEKFYPEWKGIYLAYPKSSRLSASIINLTRLISGSDHPKD